MPEKFLISVVLATYNWPQALRLCLQSLSEQTDKHFEVVVADDGSSSETYQVIETFAKGAPFKLTHIWQPDIGFRKVKILNKAIANCSGEYLIFLDGDCLAQPDFVEQHRQLSQAGIVVTGGRIMLSEKITNNLCYNGCWDFAKFKENSLRKWVNGDINKLLPLHFRLPDNSLRVYKNFVWRRIKGCNMAAWRSDVLNIKGFDEELEGWGHEDADLVFRLYLAKVKRKSGSWATEVFHLWHPPASREKSQRNFENLMIKISKAKI
ncbi:MAG: hypothetical protein RLZZ196_238 [Bacteroidota bacterium]